MDSFEKAGVKVIAISVDDQENLVEASIKSKSNFPMLQDTNGELLMKLDLLDKGGNPMNGGDVARPALVLFDKSGTVLWSLATENYRVRPTPPEVLNLIKDI